MSTTTNVQQVKVNLMTEAQYHNAEEVGEINDNEFYVITDKADIDGSIVTTKSIEDIENISADTFIPLQPDKSIYRVTVDSDVDFIFDISDLSLSSSEAFTFELCIDMTVVSSITFLDAILWQNGSTPNLTATGIYLFAFRTMDGGESWLGNLQGRWE